jgi:cell division protein FtsZ
LINISMSEDILSSDVDNATKMITDKAADNVEFIFGTAFKEDMQDEMTITVIAAGFEEETEEETPVEEESVVEEAAPAEQPAAAPVQPQPRVQPQAATRGAAPVEKKPADPDDIMAIFEILDRK